ncbi:MAG: sigma-70 family RNA polymerase sigma factor [Planctomycetes bacterium]|nr:sigma-70 family RNA polymerase sigma factor [Planctomycetota bacterium]
MDGTTEALARRAAGGDRGAFEALVALHGRTLLAVARARSADGAAAEDAFQEGLLRAWTSLGTLDRADRFLPWACSIVANAARDRGRREAVRRAAPLPEVAAPPPPGPPEARREAVLRAVAALEEPLREAVELFYFGGLSYREIARAVGMSVPTVNLRLSAARKRLRAALEDDHGG